MGYDYPSHHANSIMGSHKKPPVEYLENCRLPARFSPIDSIGEESQTCLSLFLLLTDLELLFMAFASLMDLVLELSSVADCLSCIIRFSP